jgi:hypothetical protein
MNILNISRIEPFGSIPPQAERLGLRGDFETTSNEKYGRFPTSSVYQNPAPNPIESFVAGLALHGG